MIDVSGRVLGANLKALPASRLAEDPFACPQCKSKDIILFGFFKRGFEQPCKEGEPVKDTLVLANDALQEIEKVICKGCGITTIIEDNAVYDREGLIFDLQLAIATLQGRSPVNPQGQEWKQ